jgi:hypothetical protein
MGCTDEIERLELFSNFDVSLPGTSSLTNISRKLVQVFLNV